MFLLIFNFIIESIGIKFALNNNLYLISISDVIIIIKMIKNLHSITLEKRKAILLPVETWVDILAFVDRIDLGQTVSLSCRLFDAISHAKMHEKGGHFVPELIFDSVDQFWDWQKHSKARLRIRKAEHYVQIPIAGYLPVPANILGFENIRISYLDAEIFEFLQLIRPLLSNLHLTIWPNKLHSLGSILELFNASVSQITIYGKFDEICRLYPRLIANLSMLEINGTFMGEDIGPLREWLMNLSASNKMASVLILSFSLWTLLVEQIKQDFLRSRRPSNFILHFPLSFFQFAHPFTLENMHTREHLTLEEFRFENRNGPELVLRRWQNADRNGWAEMMAEWKQIGRQKLELDLWKTNL